MKAHRKIYIFTDKYPLIGPLVWVFSVQYFIVQYFVASQWGVPYSWQQNVISDLGNTVCGLYVDRFVCSPQHLLMNCSFVLLGITMMIGSLLIYHEFKESRLSIIGFNLMALAGFGTILVGLFPENSNSTAHAVGAFLALFVGNLSLIVLSSALHLVRLNFRVYTMASGIFSTIAFILFSLNIYLRLGQGGMERLISYPQTIWLILFGLYMTRSHLKAND